MPSTASDSQLAADSLAPLTGGCTTPWPGRDSTRANHVALPPYVDAIYSPHELCPTLVDICPGGVRINVRLDARSRRNLGSALTRAYSHYLKTLVMGWCVRIMYAITLCKSLRRQSSNTGTLFAEYAVIWSRCCPPQKRTDDDRAHVWSRSVHMSSGPEL